MTSLYFNLRGTYAERKQQLSEWPRDYLESAILDGEYNDFLRDRADYRETDNDPTGHGKRIPYIGWFWRHVEFSRGTFPIGFTSDFNGFMENNKWGYNERNATPDEFAAILTIIDEAMLANQQGGQLSQIIANTNAALERLWDYFQTLSYHTPTAAPAEATDGTGVEG